MLIKYQIRNNFETVTAQTITVSGVTNVVQTIPISATTASKFIQVPIVTEFYPVDYGDDLIDIVLAEREKAINPTFDAETTKYTYNNPSVNNSKGLILQFRFWDPLTSTYSVSYTPQTFTSLDISKNKNGFKKSFFRLYFYDTNSGDTSNLIFTEDLNVYNTTQPAIPFNRLYWLRNDDFFIKNNSNRTVYMDARFFNAKNGKVTKFINIPAPPTFTSPTVPLTPADYSNPNNRSWRTSGINILNPKLNNGNFNFNPIVPFGSNTPTVITLSEFVMQ
jgi:hypothetical protein